MTYLRKGRRLSPLQPNIYSRDLLQASITRRAKHQIDCWNIYNALPGAKDPGEGLRLLLILSVQPDILAGDFNIHHTAWDPSAREEPSNGDSLLEWTVSRGLVLMNDDKISTHDAGATIDLSFVRTTAMAHCVVRHDLETESDHRTLVAHISYSGQQNESPSQLYTACDWRVFNNTLKGLLVGPSNQDPEEKAFWISDALTISLRATSKVSPTLFEVLTRHLPATLYRLRR